MIIMFSMRFKLVLAFLFVCNFLTNINAQNKIDYPHTVLENEHLKVGVYLPDMNSGYYRASRFDWSGVVSSLKYKNHEYFGEWFDKHDPLVSDAITGPVEVFSPIGYKEAKVGETFMKIGVGMLEKSDDSDYKFSGNYKIIDHGIWNVEKSKDSIVFTHSLNSANGYGYTYRKSLIIKSDGPVMTLRHSIKNTGKKNLSGTVYNHNFFTIDNTPTGKNFTVTFPFQLKLISVNNESDSLLLLKGNSIHYERDFLKGEGAMIDLAGFSTSSKDYSIRIENSLTKAGVKITGNRPLHKLAYWSIPTVLSPEPHTLIEVAPNEVFSWDIDYLFYQKSDE